MHTVKSRYKNPDTFIKKLKCKLGWFENRLDSWSRSFHRLQGSHWFTWKDNVTHGVLFNPDDNGAKKAFLGQKVKIEGRIVKYCRENDGEETVRISLGKVSLLSDD